MSFPKISLRARLVSFYVVTLCLLFGGGTLYLKAALESAIIKEAEEFLGLKTHALSVILGQGITGNKQIGLELEYNASPLLYSQVYARILNSSNQVLLATADSDGVWRNSTLEEFNNSQVKRWLSLDYRPMIGMNLFLKDLHQLPAYQIQVAMDLSRPLGTLDELVWTIEALAVVLGILTLIFGTGLSRLATAPIQQLARETDLLKSINPKRLEAENYPDELRPLVFALNDLSDQLGEKIRSLSRFAENIAHEMRNPIQILMGEAELALSKTRQLNEYRETLQSALEEYRELAQLIDSLLFIARAENNSEVLRPAEIKLKILIDELFEFFQPLAEQSQATLENQVSDQIILWADPILLKRALSNLIVNAVFYGKTTGHVVVKAERNDRQNMVISVVDDGPGLTPENAGLIFERFFRVEPSKTGVHERSTGLGLPIVKSIMELHSGRLTVSTQLGLGCEFRLEFPNNCVSY